MSKLTDDEKRFLVACLKVSFTQEELQEEDEEYFSLGQTYYSLKRKGYVGGWQIKEEPGMCEFQCQDGKKDVFTKRVARVIRIVLKEKGKEFARKQGEVLERVKELKREYKELTGVSIDSLIRAAKPARWTPPPEEPEHLRSYPQPDYDHS